MEGESSEKGGSGVGRGWVWVYKRAWPASTARSWYTGTVASAHSRVALPHHWFLAARSSVVMTGWSGAHFSQFTTLGLKACNPSSKDVLASEASAVQPCPCWVSYRSWSHVWSSNDSRGCALQFPCRKDNEKRKCLQGKEERGGFGLSPENMRQYLSSRPWLDARLYPCLRNLALFFFLLELRKRTFFSFMFR